MKPQTFDIQTNETGGDFPFKLFKNTNVATFDHCHNEVELILVLSNKMNCCINGIKYTLNAGDILFIASGDVHSIESSPPHQRMVVQFKLEILKGLYGYNKDKEALINKMQSMARTSPAWDEKTAKKVAGIILSLNHTQKSMAGTAMRFKICSLLYRLAEICFNETPDDPEQKEKYLTDRNRKTLLQVERIFDYVQANYNRDLTIESVSSYFGYSPNYFTKIWKKYTGTSFHNYLNEYRINRACALLKDTDLLISKIGSDTGFKSIKTFNRVFKSVTGMSPGEYRLSLKQNIEKISSPQ